jgi:N-acetylglucosamine kinase-like BadF-type ATPase
VTSRAAAVLAVDGGNSKTDVALVAADGSLLAAVRGPTSSHQAVGREAATRTLRRLVEEAAGGPTGGRPVADDGIYAVAGADYPSDLRLLERAYRREALAGSTLVLNDTFGALRAGSSRGWGVVLVCGHGINGAAVGPNGKQARFAGVGDISGDWGGGGAVGMAAVAAAVRARDGRGPRTVLEQLVPEAFGRRSPEAVTRALYHGRLEASRLAELSPVVFAAAAGGDGAARAIVDRLADELVTMAAALIRRLRLQRLAPGVVLAGGVFRTHDGGFHERLAAGIAAVAPGAQLVLLDAPPVLGAALIGLDRRSPGGTTPAAVEDRLRAALEVWQPAT